MEVSPLSVLRDAQKSVPAVKYAAGISGVAAVVAIIAGFQLDYRIAVFGTIIVLGLMFVLVILSSLVAHTGSSLIALSLFAAWSFMLLTIAASLFLLTSYFFSWPKSIDSYITNVTQNISQDEEHINEPTENNMSLPASGYVKFSSEAGDYIGQGMEHEFSDENGIFSINGDKNSISINFEGDDLWSFDFSAPRDKELKVGQFTSAQRAAFHNPVKPGIDISGAGRGCNEISGEFVIKQIEYSSTNKLERFHADFKQYCEKGSPKLVGEINVIVNQ